MKTTISINDFTFRVKSYGRYHVMYTSPTTGKCWTMSTNDMSLIDATKNAEDPLKKDLESLRKLCKKGLPRFKLIKQTINF